MERVEQVADMVKHGVPADAAVKLYRHAKRLHRLAEIACNRETTDAEDAEDERRTKAVEEICREIGIKATVSGDPRGYVVKLHFKEPRGNTWGGDETGWGIG